MRVSAISALAAFAFTFSLASCTAAKGGAPQRVAAPAESPAASATVAAQPTAAPSDADASWRVRDNGKRCIVAPCPSWTATNASSGASAEIAGVDLAALALGAKDEASVRAKILSGQLLARGRIVVVPKMGPGGDGKVLRVSATVTP